MGRVLKLAPNKQKGAMNTFYVVMLVTGALAIFLFIKRRNSKNKAFDNYNDFYLGEVTTRDIPANLTRKEKEYARIKILKQKEALKSQNEIKKEETPWKRKY